MKKKILALLLVLVMLVSMLPLSAAATAPSAAKEEQVIQRVSQIYRRTRAGSGKTSLRGYCGLMTGLQLYYMGINTSYMIFDGKDQYNAYLDMTETTGGYGVTVYPGSQYSLEEALNQATKGGTTDVYNILVGFHRTNTAAGSIYGHAVVIHAILDGMVYFVEGFHTSIGGSEGTPIKCSIETFADYYDSWTTFEGIVVFGSKEYADQCESYSADLYVRATEQAELMEQPGGPDCKAVRTAPAGERLHATGLYKNTEDALYYRIDDSGITAYVKAEQVEAVRSNYETVVLEGGTVPETLEVGEHFQVTGKVRSDAVELGSTFVTVLDAEGTPCLVASVENHGWSHDLGTKAMDSALCTEYLPEGTYRYQIAAYTLNHYAQDGQIREYSDEVVLAESSFTVGDVTMSRARSLGPQSQDSKEGWVLESGKWYYYQNGKTRTGWFCEDGIDYYLDETGAALTGWQEINGELRFFTNTGAMRTGWLRTEQGTMYMTRNGVAAKGFHTFEDKLWYFDENGLLPTEQWLELDGERYLVRNDGSIATGWVETEDVYLAFREDGRYYAEVARNTGNAPQNETES